MIDVVDRRDVDADEVCMGGEEIRGTHLFMSKWSHVCLNTYPIMVRGNKAL